MYYVPLTVLGNGDKGLTKIPALIDSHSKDWAEQINR